MLWLPDLNNCPLVPISDSIEGKVRTVPRLVRHAGRIQYRLRIHKCAIPSGTNTAELLAAHVEIRALGCRFALGDIQRHKMGCNVSVRSAHLDEVWAGAEDDPMWTLTRVPTWGINGHFGAGSR